MTGLRPQQGAQRRRSLSAACLMPLLTVTAIVVASPADASEEAIGGEASIGAALEGPVPGAVDGEGSAGPEAPSTPPPAASTPPAIESPAPDEADGDGSDPTADQGAVSPMDGQGSASTEFESPPTSDVRGLDGPAPRSHDNSGHPVICDPLIVGLCDTDGDGLFDPADPDDDDDLLADGADNCPLRQNADQADSDGDGIGDACDPTPFPAAPTSGDETEDDGKDKKKGKKDGPNKKRGGLPAREASPGEVPGFAPGTPDSDVIPHEPAHADQRMARFLDRLQDTLAQIQLAFGEREFTSLFELLAELRLLQLRMELNTASRDEAGQLRSEITDLLTQLTIARMSRAESAGERRAAAKRYYLELLALREAELADLAVQLEEARSAGDFERATEIRRRMQELIDEQARDEMSLAEDRFGRQEAFANWVARSEALENEELKDLAKQLEAAVATGDETAADDLRRQIAEILANQTRNRMALAASAAERRQAYEKYLRRLDGFGLPDEPLQGCSADDDGTLECEDGSPAEAFEGCATTTSDKPTGELGAAAGLLATAAPAALFAQADSPEGPVLECEGAQLPAPEGCSVDPAGEPGCGSPAPPPGFDRCEIRGEPGSFELTCPEAFTLEPRIDIDLSGIIDLKLSGLGLANPSAQITDQAGNVISFQGKLDAVIMELPDQSGLAIDDVPLPPLDSPSKDAAKMSLKYLPEVTRKTLGQAGRITGGSYKLDAGNQK